MEKLSEKQARFTRCLARIILWLNSVGYDVVLTEVFRTPEQAKLNKEKGVGIANSLHTKCLAADIYLFKGGKYLEDFEEYRVMGEQWKKMGPDHCWGGDFTSRDGVHISIEHEGVR